MADEQQRSSSGAADSSEKRPGYERCWDQAFCGTARENRMPLWFAHIAEAVIFILFKILFRYKIVGREEFYQMRNKTGFVLVSNHSSFADPLFIYLALLPKMRPRNMARDKLFSDQPAIFGWILAHVGVIPIKRDAADRNAVKRAARLLKNNETIVIFPEGTRRGLGTKTPMIHGGASLIARMGHAPIVPVGIRNADKIKPTGERMHFPKVTVVYGDPLLVSDFDFVPKDQRLEACTWYAMRECFALKQQEPAEEVNMRELFPDGEDYTELFAKQKPVRHTASELAAALDEKARKKLTQGTKQADGAHPSEDGARSGERS